MSRCALIVVVGALLAATASAEVVSETARSEARRLGRTRVVVALEPVRMRRGARLADRRAEVARRCEGVIASLAAENLEVRRTYENIAGFSAEVDEAALEALGVHPEVMRVDLDGVGGGALDTSIPQIRADRVHNRSFTGAGALIAILDTGVAADHPDVAGALVAEHCFCTDNCCPNRNTEQSGPGSARSRHEHGIHVTGIALSRGQVSSVGAAPGARLVSVKVLDDANRGFLSDWIAGLDWVVSEQPEVRAVNMSLASDLVLDPACDDSCQGDSLCAENMLFAELIEMLRARGTLVFAASGNRSSPGRLSSPSCVTAATSVGAVDSTDRLANFSNGGGLVDLLAPGVGIVSDGLGGGTAVLSGTSMATPHATGTAALLFAAHPAATAEQVERVMIATGRPISIREEVAPRIDAFAAFQSITQTGELVAGGGGSRDDCLLEWNFLPADAARGGTRPIARCRDNDPLCDADTEAGRCTFQLALCFNVSDPLLPKCATAATVASLVVATPKADAPFGSVERANSDALRLSLPAFPLEGTNVCGTVFPFVVTRSGGDRGIAYASMSTRAAGRSDHDRFALVCDPP